MDIRLGGGSLGKRPLVSAPIPAHSSSETREGLRVTSGHTADPREAYKVGWSCIAAQPCVAKRDVGQRVSCDNNGQWELSIYIKRCLKKKKSHP